MNQADWIEEESHPPLPPDCAYFRDGSFVANNYSKTNQEICVWLGCDSPELALFRPIIASVAYKAWIKDAESKTNGQSLTFGINVNALLSLNNAHEWDIWGDKK